MDKNGLVWEARLHQGWDMRGRPRRSFSDGVWILILGVLASGKAAPTVLLKEFCVAQTCPVGAFFPLQEQ